MNKQDLQNKLEPFIYDKLEKEEYEIVGKNPVELLTWNRLDLSFRLFYIDNKNKCNEMAIKVYYQVIKSQTLGTFKEVGNEHKFDIYEFIKSFNMTYNDIKNNGFDKSKTIIPLSSNGTIVNGAHRLSSAIHLNENIYCIKTNAPTMIADYKYFYDRNVSEEILDVVTTKFVEYAKNTYIAFLWPSGKGSKKLAESKFSNIVYKKKISLSSNGGYNLLFELYKHMDWIGNEKNNYKGIQQKLIECFTSFESFTVLVFQSNSIEKVREIKEEVRKIYNIGYSSIHITDTKEEAIRISRLIFNENGLHFLNYGNPFKIKSFVQQLEVFANFIKKNNINRSDIVLDSSIVLSLYGLRKASDVDYLLDDDTLIIKPNRYIEPHDEVLKHYKKTKNELIYNPNSYFYYKGFKFISFNELFIMKKNRNEGKDKNDCKIMESLIENNSLKKIVNQFKQLVFYFKIKFKNNIVKLTIAILKFTRTYNVIRSMYRNMKKRDL